MLTNTGIVNELVRRGWHCPFCINRALDALLENFAKGHHLTRQLTENDVRIFHEVSVAPNYGLKVTQVAHEWQRHEGPLFEDPKVPYGTSRIVL